ncbi:MAG: hypothetical protein ABI409_09835, partial [Ramlibacter sp.]
EIVDQSRAPEWINKLPADDENLYFLGISDGRDYVAVREASKTNAYDQARAYLDGRLKTSGSGGGVDSTSAAKYLLDSARVAGTYSNYDRSRGAFRSYTLLSVSKKVAESDLRWYGAKNAQQVSPVQQQRLKNSVRTQDAYSNRK